MFWRFRTTVLCIICLFVFSIDTCHASPSAPAEGRKRSKLTAPTTIAAAVEEINAPYERCFQTTCNRVTHYCDQNIQSCASCEDDCHPSRITGDELATKDCQRICDWYYYLKSLEVPRDLASSVTTEHSEQTDNMLPTCGYAFMTVMVVATCFTVLTLVLLGTFLCIFKRSVLQPNASTERTQSPCSPIYSHSKMQSSSLTTPKGNENRETIIKLLDYSGSIKTGEQESIEHSAHGYSMNLSSARTSRCKNHAAQVHADWTFQSQGQEDSSTQPLV